MKICESSPNISYMEFLWKGFVPDVVGDVEEHFVLVQISCVRRRNNRVPFISVQMIKCVCYIYY